MRKSGSSVKQKKKTTVFGWKGLLKYHLRGSKRWSSASKAENRKILKVIFIISEFTYYLHITN